MELEPKGLKPCELRVRYLLTMMAGAEDVYANLIKLERDEKENTRIRLQDE